MQYFILIIAILLIVFNVRAIKKEKNSFNSTLEYASQDMSEFEVKLGMLRKEFSETILELQSEIQVLKLKLDNKSVDEGEQLQLDEESLVNAVDSEKSSHKNSGYSDKSYIIKDKTELIDYNNIKKDENSHNIEEKEDSNSIKINEIERLIKDGLSVDEICEKLGIGKGEVLLIKDLYLK